MYPIRAPTTAVLHSVKSDKIEFIVSYKMPCGCGKDCKCGAEKRGDKCTCGPSCKCNQKEESKDTCTGTDHKHGEHAQHTHHK